MDPIIGTLILGTALHKHRANVTYKKAKDISRQAIEKVTEAEMRLEEHQNATADAYERLCTRISGIAEWLNGPFAEMFRPFEHEDGSYRTDLFGKAEISNMTYIKNVYVQRQLQQLPAHKKQTGSSAAVTLLLFGLVGEANRQLDTARTQKRVSNLVAEQSDTLCMILDTQKEQYLRVYQLLGALNIALIKSSGMARKSLSQIEWLLDDKGHIDWKNADRFYLDGYNWLEDYNFDFERSGWFHDEEYYRTWINVDGYDKYYYDLTEAEAQFRDDMDHVVDSIIESVVKSRVESVTLAYFAKAKSTLNEKLDILQKELKLHIKIDEGQVFQAEIQSVYQKIRATEMPEISPPRARIDTEYNGDYRFYSEGKCEDAAKNRRERAYNDGHYFIRQLPSDLNDRCLDQIRNTLTNWKRLVLQSFDISGKKYPDKRLYVTVGNSSVHISLNNFDEVESLWDDTIKRHVDRDILNYGTSVGDVTYKSEYSLKITIYHDYDLRETLFGGLKEVNNRYAYSFPDGLYEFKWSADEVAAECTKVLQASPTLQEYLDNIKENFIKELQKITGSPD